jgi:hypothetical protein
VAQVLGDASEGRVLFEPCLNPQARAVAGDSLRPYLLDPGHAPALKKHYDRLLSGRIHGSWIDKAGFRPWSDTLILKLIRVNMMLPWLAANYPEVPMILLLRHPVPVAKSAVAQGWESPLLPVLDTPGLPPDLVAAAKRALAYPPGSYHQWLAHWALESAMMLRSARTLGAPIYFYEHLRRSPATEFSRLARSAGVELTRFRADEVGRPSVTAADPSWKAAGQVGAWLEDCTPAELQWAEEMLTEFSLGALYEARSPFPCAQA